MMTYVAVEVRNIATEIHWIEAVLAALVLFDLIFLWAFLLLHRGMRRFERVVAPAIVQTGIEAYEAKKGGTAGTD